jgi:lipopolysaccharide exporter
MTLKQRAIKGVKWTSFSSVVGAGSQLLQLVILTWYLSPEDFGLMALALVVIGFSQIFLDMGVSNAIIHKQEISKEELDTLYILNIGSGFLIFCMLFLLAPFLAAFYKEPELKTVIRWVSLSFIIQPFGQQFLVLLKKELQFNEIAKRDVASKSISLVVAVALAVQGWGVYSLVFANISTSFVSTALLLFVGLKYHRPSLFFRFSLVKQSITFGLYQMGENFINYFNTQFDSILIGKLLGVEALGIYDIAKNLAMRPAMIINPIITQVTFPLLSKMKNNIESVKGTYLKTTNYLASINFPIYIFICVFAEPLILLLFGDKWLAAVPILRVLSLYGMIRSTGNPVGALLLSRGRADLGFYWNLGLFLLIPISIYFGSKFGIIGTAFTLLILQISLLVPAWALLIKKCCNANFKEYFKQLASPLFLSIPQGLSYFGLLYFLEDPKYSLIAGSTLMIISSILLNKIFNRTFFNMVLTSFIPNKMKSIA